MRHAEGLSGLAGIAAFVAVVLWVLAAEPIVEGLLGLMEALR
jgi:hypothetical protein